MAAACSVNTMPSRPICRLASPRAATTNCGRKDRKNSATLGLMAAATSPLANSRPAGSPDAPAVVTRAPPRLLIAPQPIQIRYRPPATLSALKAAGEAAISALTPITASTVWLMQPKAHPSPKAMPRSRPLAMPVLSTIRLSGPGERVIRMAAARKPKSCSGESMGMSKKETGEQLIACSPAHVRPRMFPSSGGACLESYDFLQLSSLALAPHLMVTLPWCSLNSSLRLP